MGVVHTVPKEFSVLPNHIFEIYSASDVFIAESVGYAKDPQPNSKIGKSSNVYASSIPVVQDMVAKGLTSGELAKKMLSSDPADLYYMFDAVLNYKRILPQKIEYVEGFDAQLFRRALREKKATDTLESRQRAYESWAQKCNTTQDHFAIIQSLRNALTDLDPLDDVNVITNSFVQSGDIAALTKMKADLVRKRVHVEYIERCSVIPRNFEWIPKVEAFSQKYQRPLVAVGSMHLTSEPSFLTLLKQNGYTLTRVRASEVK